MKKKETKVLSIAILAVVLAVIVTYYFYPDIFLPEKMSKSEINVKSEGKKAGSVTPVKVFIPRTIEISDGIRSVGTLLPNDILDVTSEVSGKVVSISFDDGMRVKRGRLLVKLDDRDLIAQLKRAEFNLKMVKERLERQRILLAKDAVSRESFDQVETEYNMLEADIELLRVNIDRTQIRAPFDGVVSFCIISVGSYLQPNTKITTLVDNSKLKVEFSIPEKYISNKLKGQKVEFTTEDSDRKYTATVFAIDPMVDVKTRTITLRALYNNSDGRLSAGMFARVAMAAGGIQSESLVIPTEAVIPQMEGKSVWVARGGKATSVKIVTGTRTDDMIEVLSGITPADSVIITGIMQMREGAAVEVTE